MAGDLIQFSGGLSPKGRAVQFIGSIIEPNLRVTFEAEVVVPDASTDQEAEEAAGKVLEGLTERWKDIQLQFEHVQTVENYEEE